MVNKIIETLKEYLASHDRDIITLSEESQAEIKAQIKYLECMKDFSYVAEIENLKTRIESLQDVIVGRTAPSSSDQRVTRKDFVAIYEKVIKGLENENENDIEDGACFNQIYGKDFTVHWNGIYCDCLDGCNPCNYLIPAIENIEEDSDGFEVEF